MLLHKGPLPVNQIGEKVNVTSGSITIAVDRLERKGWWSGATIRTTGGRG